ncbi:unnamed protein product, partial [Rotaria sp. Silwood1]
MNDDVWPDYILQLQQERQEVISQYDREIDETKSKLQVITDELKAINNKLYNLIEMKYEKREALLKKINEHKRKYK